MLESAEAQASEAVRELRHYASRVELDPEALREAEARIEALHAAARRHRVRPEELPATLAELEQRLHELELAVEPEALQKRGRRGARALRRGGEEAVGQARRRRAGALQGGHRGDAAARHAGGALRRRAAAAGRAAAQRGRGDRIRGGLASQPAAAPARQGRLGRRALAHQPGDPAGRGARPRRSPTLVFDEVDAGIGGAVAETVGRSLQALGKRAPGAVRHAPAAGRGVRRCAMVGGEIIAAAEGPACSAWIARRASRSSRACLAAPRHRAQARR